MLFDKGKKNVQVCGGGCFRFIESSTIKNQNILIIKGIFIFALNFYRIYGSNHQYNLYR